jgi:crossover junction endodeoxyribonuclease RusA
MADYSFLMPWPPSVNHWHQPCRGRIIKGSKARKYESDSVAHLKSIGLSGESLSSNLKVKLILNPPTLARYDIDNRTKGVFDALSAANFWVDDCQVVELKIVKGEKIKGGQVLVCVSVN